EFHAAAADKIIEEAFELYRELVVKNSSGILKESADLLEIILAEIKPFGFDMTHIVEMMGKRVAERGGFKKRLFLDQVGGSELCNIQIQRHPFMIFNPSQKQHLLTLLKGEMERSREVWIASAFYDPGAANLLIKEFSRFIEQGGKIRMLLSTMGNMVDPDYFIHLENHIQGILLKIFHPPEIAFDENPPNFHVKVWLFHHQNSFGAILTGSSNFTGAGLLRNVEWNYFSPLEVNLPFNTGDTPFITAVNEFERIWSHQSVVLSSDFLAGYTKRFKKSSYPQTTRLFEQVSTWDVTVRHIKPNSAQQEALDNLNAFRKKNIQKCAIIAATGIGKTYLAAFDFLQSGYRRLLFIAHRESILSEALKTFRQVMNDPLFGKIHGGGQAAHPECPSVFAMIQTLSRNNHIEKFAQNDFDYIVIDEFHHAEAAGYRKILQYFQPQFMLGLTATPERMDGRDILAHCDYNIAFEVRLFEAIKRNLLTPFQYFAIYDEIDYESIKWRGSHYDEDELNQSLINDTRTNIVACNLKKYLPASGKIKALAFCSSVSHARFTADKLSQDHGLTSCALWSNSTDEERRHAIERLETETDPLNVICTVDIFNEGVDIPRLSHVLFLRPTLSFTVFLQQLGRGLRKVDGKDFLVVIDFVGNFRKAHVAPLAMCGYTSFEDFSSDSKVCIEKMLADNLPQGCYVSPDIEVRRIWDHQIRAIIDKKLSTAERLKNIYQNIKNDLGQETPLSLMDMFVN
ncbi:MAG: DEAD/DEAH box helicase family protein, partial [Desulfobacterales bacterium]|nr:DEAD/DEAH box helicase family protein [Desulfobacterales bacterium]